MILVFLLKLLISIGFAAFQLNMMLMLKILIQYNALRLEISKATEERKKDCNCNDCRKCTVDFWRHKTDKLSQDAFLSYSVRHGLKKMCSHGKFNNFHADLKFRSVWKADLSSGRLEFHFALSHVNTIIALTRHRIEFQVGVSFKPVWNFPCEGLLT